MQLRVPKKYRPRQQRRQLVSRRFLWLIITASLFSFLAYLVMQNPQVFREGASGLGETMAEQIGNARDNMFPEQPTATPDVRQEMVSCDNAYLVGDLEEVIEVCSLALKGMPNDVTLHYRIAYAMVVTSSGGSNTERINAAIDMANQAIAANPESPLGWAVKAMALDFAQKHNLALGAVQRALEIDPNLVIAKAHLGNIYRNLGRPELARTTLDEAMLDLQARGGDSEAQAQVYRNYGKLLSSQGDYEGALDFYQRARQAMPQHIYVAIEMAEIYFALGVSEPSNNALAAGILQETLSVAPRDPAVLFMLGNYNFGQGDVPKAIDYFTRCLDVNPDDVGCLSLMGRIYYFSQSPDNYPLVVQYLSHATELGSTNPYDWYLLGRAYFRMGQCDNAATPLREGYALRQQNESTQVALEDFNNALRECNLSAQ